MLCCLISLFYFVKVSYSLHEHQFVALYQNLICSIFFPQELYSRQKKNLQNNLHHKDKKLLGETYSKGRSDLRSIIYPYNHPFQQDELEVTVVINILYIINAPLICHW